MIRTDLFEAISLEGIEQVKLMNRVDQKYWLSSTMLPEIFREIKDSYYVLDINGEQQLPYTSTYYDTVKDDMYRAHHNGKLNRFKIRRRTYLASGISFLEVKNKNNKGRTFKSRVSCDMENKGFSENEVNFIENILPFNVNKLRTSIKNEFTRITLVNKNFTERCTFDLNLKYFEDDKEMQLNDLLIIEVKSDGKPKYSPLVAVLKRYRVKASGFSKYCIGRTLLNENLKHNAFKSKIRSLQKLVGSEFSVQKIVESKNLMVNSYE